MGNLLSVHRSGFDGRLHICDRCGWHTSNKTALRIHIAHQCHIRPDGRWKHGSRRVAFPGELHPHQHYQHQHEGCSGCEEEHNGQWDDEELRAAINEELEQLQRDTGEELPPEAAAALADLLVGIMGNGRFLPAGCACISCCVVFVIRHL